ncbi:MAG: serine/threonine-protein kinase [Myxococcaceae bacterium]
MSSGGPQVLGDYALLTLLAKGGMAETYLAERGGKRLVVKKLLPQTALDEEGVRGFIDEARLCSRLQHPNVAQVFDFGEADGQLFLAMEFIHGRSLQQFISRADRVGFYRLPPTLSCFIAARMLEGLHHAHTRVDEKGKPLKIVHRDISPENVLVSFEGEVKVIDFGIAKAQLEGRGETAPGMVKGKYQYVSPEQATAQPLDPRSDVFSVTIVLYLMLCGRLPFEGQPYQAMRAIARGDFPRPKTVFPELPDRLEQVLLKGLAVNRDQRYASAQAMREDLEAYLRDVAPGFGQEQVKELMQYLYYDELEAEGTPLPNRTSLEVGLTAWRDSPQGATDLAPKPGESETKSSAKWLVFGAVGLVAVLLAIPLVGNLGAVFEKAPEQAKGPPPQILRAQSEKKFEKTLPAQNYGGNAVTTDPQNHRVIVDNDALENRQGGFNGIQTPAEQSQHSLDVGDNQRAYEVASDCVRVDSSDLDCMWVAGVSAWRLGKDPEARQLLTRLVDLAPDHPKAARARRFLEKGEQLY